MSVYGLFCAAAFWAAMIVALRRARAGGLEPSFVFKLGVISTVAGILGGRLGFISQNPDLFEWTLDRGYILMGGLVGALSVGIFYSLWHGKNLLVVGDVVNPAIILGIGIGRIGCHFAGCCTPTQLYEAAACFAIFGFLSWLFYRDPRVGLIPCWCYMLYPAARFILEFFRDDPNRSGFSALGMTFTQWVCLSGFAMAFTGLVTLLRGTPRLRARAQICQTDLGSSETERHSRAL